MSQHPLELVTAHAPFHSRADAGRVLARSLARYRNAPGLIVLGIARGGVPVARAVADALDAPLNVLVARKLGVPGIEDVALGAIAEGNHRVVADSVAWYLGVPGDVIDRLATREQPELERRVATYRTGLPVVDLRGRTVVIVDDGLATGATMRAAIQSVRDQRPARIIAAVPVASRSSAEDVRQEADEMIAVVCPARFDAISAAYDDYSPVDDNSVLAALGQPTRRVSDRVRDISYRMGTALTRADGQSNGFERTIAIPAFDTTVVADLGIPPLAPSPKGPAHPTTVRGLAIVAHSGGSSRNSYRNRYVAGRLRLNGYATLRLDLLTQDEQSADDASASHRFDVGRLATRLACVCEWAESEGVPGAHRTILVGSSTGAAVALMTAARRPGRVFAVVTRGGSVDLAAPMLPNVLTPVLMVVGDDDAEASVRTAAVLERLPRGAELVRVPRAGPTFAEPGALGAAAERLVAWLDRLETHHRRRSRWGA